MKKFIKNSLIASPLANSVYRFFRYIWNYPAFLKNFYLFKIKSKGGRFKAKFINIYPCLYDKTKTTPFDAHYIYHPAWAARIIAETKPKRHVDISSTLHFATIVSAFIPIEFYDYRPAKLNLNNLTSNQADLLALPFANNSIESLSCMHTIEHVGLGRYGDPLDPDGDIKGMNELKRVLSKNGNLLFVVPIGRPKIMFNAHRIYSYEQIIEHFSDLELKEFSLIPDNAEKSGIIKNPPLAMTKKQSYACGCFWFKKTDE